MLKKKIIKYKFLIAFLISFIYFLVHLAIINDYGISWDFHYHHYAGLYHLGLPVRKTEDKPEVPFTPPDPRLTIEDPFGPFIQIIPTLSYIIFYEKLHILPFDSAYNLPMVISGSAGIGLLFVFVFETLGFGEAIVSSLFLGLLPVHFGYLHNNMKDVPNAFWLTFSVYLFYRLVQFRRPQDLITSAAGFAIAFNFKINSIVVPIINVIWYMTSYIKEILGVMKKGIMFLKQKRIYIIVLYFFIAPLLAIILWIPFWRHPLAKLLELPYFFSHNTIFMPVLLNGNIFKSGVNIPWYYPFIYLLITTPIPILIFFLTGLIICFFKLFNKKTIYALLILWFIIPLLRYFDPRAGAIDGVRHFMEVIYPLCFIAGIGFMSIFKSGIKYINKSILYGLTIIMFIGLVKNIVHFHPYQTSFFNANIGGIRGAWGKFDIDFWGTPQKEAMLWLNRNASIGANIFVAMAQSSAGMYLRSDLKENLNLKDLNASDFTVILNRQSYFYSYDLENYIEKKTSEGKIVYKRDIDGVALVWIFRK